MEFLGLLSTGKGTWGQIAGLIERGEWDKIVLVGPSYAEKFSSSKKIEFVKINFDQPLKELVEEFREKLKGRFEGMEIALSLASGSGREHMAIISALIQIPVGIKFVALTKDGIIEL